MAGRLPDVSYVEIDDYLASSRSASPSRLASSFRSARSTHLAALFVQSVTFVSSNIDEYLSTLPLIQSSIYRRALGFLNLQAFTWIVPMCRLSSLPLSEAINQLAGADNRKLLLHTVVGREILTGLLTKVKEVLARSSASAAVSANRVRSFPPPCRSGPWQSDRARHARARRGKRTRWTLPVPPVSYYSTLFDRPGLYNQSASAPAPSASPSLSSALPAAPPVDALPLPETVTSSTFEAHRASGAFIPPQANSMQSSRSPSTFPSVSQQRFIQFVSTTEGWQAIVTMMEAIQQRIGVDNSRVFHM